MLRVNAVYHSFSDHLFLLVPIPFTLYKNARTEQPVQSCIAFSACRVLMKERRSWITCVDSYTVLVLLPSAFSNTSHNLFGGISTKDGKAFDQSVCINNICVCVRACLRACASVCMNAYVRVLQHTSSKWPVIKLMYVSILQADFFMVLFFWKMAVFWALTVWLKTRQRKTKSYQQQRGEYSSGYCS